MDHPIITDLVEPKVVIAGSILWKEERGAKIVGIPDWRSFPECNGKICLIVIYVWLDRFISVRSLRPHLLHILSSILLRVHYWGRPIAIAIRLPTYLRGVTTFAIVTSIIMTIRPTLTLSMPPTT